MQCSPAHPCVQNPHVLSLSPSLCLLFSLSNADENLREFRLETLLCMRLEREREVGRHLGARKSYPPPFFFFRSGSLPRFAPLLKHSKRNNTPKNKVH